MKTYATPSFPERARRRVLTRRQWFGLHQFPLVAGAGQPGVYGGAPWVWVVVAWDG